MKNFYKAKQVLEQKEKQLKEKQLKGKQLKEKLLKEKQKTNKLIN
jgi:hypothetical protein